MADFSTNDLKRESVPANAAPVAPVQEGPNPFAGLIGTVAKEGVDFLKAAGTSSTIADYNKRVDFINQQLEQGVISESKATSQIRSVTSRALAANPQLTKEISQAHNAFKGSTAVGEALDAEEQKKEIELARTKEATLNGWVVDGMSAEQTKRATSAYFADKRVDDELNEMREQKEFELSQARGQETLNKARSEANQLANQNRMQHLLRGKVDNNFIRFSTTAEALLKNVNRSDPQSVRSVQMFIDGELSRLTNEANRFTTVLDNEFINQQLKPFQDLATLYKTALTDDEALKALENSIGMIEKSAKFGMYNQSPDLAKLNATSDIFKTMPAEVTQLLLNSPTVGKFYADVMTEALGAAPADPISGSDEERGNKMKTLTETLNLSNEEDRETAVKGINKMLGGLNAFALVQDDPRQFRELSKFLASPEFAHMVNNGELEAAAGLSASQVMKVNFEQHSLNAATHNIKDTFTRNSGRKDKMQDVFELEFTGTGLTARRKDVFMNVPDRGNLDAIVRQIQPALQMISQNIKMQSHLNGHTDYKKTWEEEKGAYFPAFFGTTLQEAISDAGVPDDENAEINRQIESGEATEVTVEDVKNMSEEKLRNLLIQMTGSQRTALLRDAGFVE